jgi:teichuronic acid biosynthesis glycosyltransferase TuaC
MAMKVLVLAEYYPRVDAPVLGIWTHRQALAARDAGADVRVLVLHRPVPPLAALRTLDPGRMRQAISQPSTARLDGLQVDYVRYLSPPRPWSYGSWGAWAAPLLRRALGRLRATFPFELVHAHYAVPSGDALRRAAAQIPMVLSIHGGDLYGAHARSGAVSATLAHAGVVLANSAGTARRCTELGARDTRVVHLGADLPPKPRTHTEAHSDTDTHTDTPILVTVGHLIARKRHADVISALALLRERHPTLRYVIVGDGPERERLRALSRRLGVGHMVELRGELAHQDAVATAHAGTVFVLPSIDEAFGVAYIEAMAGGVPTIGCRGEDGPEEIAAAGGGIALVDPRDAPALAAQIDAWLSDPARLAETGREARLTVERAFTWSRCGQQTLQAYRDVLRAPA